MKDPCRICGVRAVGSQCRWIFSNAAKMKLQVILSHVLGREVTRDGRGEFLCGKCVFQLEKVVQCDVDMGQLQDEHQGHMQKLQAEKEHLMQCIGHVYKKNNPGWERSELEATGWKTLPGPLWAGSPEDPAPEEQPFKEIRMKRCVSLDQIASRGAPPGRSGLRGSRLGSATGLNGSMRSFALRGTRQTPQSSYLDLVQRKGMLPRPGFKGRSTSLQSLNRDSSSDTPPEPAAKLKPKPKVSVIRHAASEDVQAKLLLHSSPGQPSIISDLIQLLRCISRQQVCAPAGSHIPVLKRTSSGPHSLPAKRRLREAEWKSLHDLTEEYDDEYTPARVEVAGSSLTSSTTAPHFFY